MVGAPNLECQFTAANLDLFADLTSEFKENSPASALRASALRYAPGRLILSERWTKQSTLRDAASGPIARLT